MAQIPFLKEIDERFAAIEATALGNALPSAEIIVGSAGGVSAAVAMSGDATISNAGAVTIAADAVVTAKILDANVTVAKLAVALQPSHVVKYAGVATTAGGDADEVLSVDGALATDIAVVMKKSGTGYVLAAAVDTDVINVTMSEDPGAASVLSYVVYRAIA